MKKVVIILCYSVVFFNNNAHNLVNIKTIIPDIILDIRYATDTNFTKTKIYDRAECYLLSHVAHALKSVHEELKLHGYKLKVFDGYRPIHAQRKMWQIFPDPRYVSDPDVECGRHTRGTTVDVSLVSLDGKEVIMPSEFDCFEERAHANYPHLSSDILYRRDLLKNSMLKYGFIGIQCEWWHFDFKDWQQYSPLDLKLSQLN